MKELITEEKLYASLAPEITDSTNPLDGAISNAEQKEAEAAQSVNDVNAQLEFVEKKISGGSPAKPTLKARKVMKFSFGVTGVIVFLLLAFSIVVSLIKLFADISWNTWEWLLYALIGCLAASVVLTFVYLIVDKVRTNRYEKKLAVYTENVEKAKALNKKKSEQEFTLRHRKEDLAAMYRKRYNTLGYAMNHVIGLPFPHSKVEASNYDLLKEKYLNILEMQNNLHNADDEAGKGELRKKLTEQKINFFYTQSMKYEISMPEVYSEFKKQYDEGKASNELILRRDISVSNSRGGLELLEIAKYKEIINSADSLSPVIAKFKAVANANTKGIIPFFTSSSKKAQQTKDMQLLVEEAKKVYEKIKDMNWHIAYALEYARSCAYRNIYLGAELINYIRDTAEGGTLAKRHDDKNVKSLNVDSSNIDDLELDKNLFDGVLDQMLNIINVVDGNPLIKNLVLKNPKITIIVGALEVIIKVVTNHLSNLNANAQAQAQLTEALKTIADAYNDGKASLLRSIEIIGSIVEANKGFAAIYEPLSEKVFVNGTTDKAELKEDIVQLAYAVSKYKVIADSKIK